MDNLRDPINASIFGAIATAGYMFMKAKLNNEPKPQMNEYTKPAILVAVLVYFIVSQGAAAKEVISVEPF